MNRIIKFRAWDKDEEKMDHNIGLVGNRILFEYGDIESDDSSVEAISYVDIDEHNEKYFEIMQYTGLKDKNDKEIYEGDIVDYPDASRCGESYDYDCYINRGIVEYDLDSMSYHFTNRETVDMEDICIKDEVEVIGNIYENPELLKE